MCIAPNFLAVYLQLRAFIVESRTRSLGRRDGPHHGLELVAYDRQGYDDIRGLALYQG